SPDGRLLATASHDGTARTWDIASGTARATLQGHDSSVQSVAFSPDGALLATASGDGTARIWDIASGATRVTLRGHIDVVRGVVVAPDRPLIATASDDGTVRIWDLATGTSRAVLIPFADGGYATITDDGYKLDGDPGGRFWWAVKMCRFDPGELD